MIAPGVFRSILDQRDKACLNSGPFSSVKICDSFEREF